MSKDSIRRWRPPVFDWYQATVPEDPDIVINELGLALGARRVPTKGMHGYAEGVGLERDGEFVARVLYGGYNGSPNVSSSGSDAIVTARLLRERWPVHRVTRFDSAYDLAGGWDKTLRTVKDLALERGLTLNTYGDWLTPSAPKGRTLYVGSPASPVRLRLYEKGKQLRQAGGIPEGREDELAPLKWVRLELQVRPQKGRKSDAAGLEPSEVWGMSSWSLELHERLFDLELEPLPMHVWRAPDDARAWKYLGLQYGPLLGRMAELDGWDSVVDRLRKLVMGENDDA